MISTLHLYVDFLLNHFCRFDFSVICLFLKIGIFLIFLVLLPPHPCPRGSYRTQHIDVGWWPWLRKSTCRGTCMVQSTSKIMTIMTETLVQVHSFYLNCEGQMCSWDQDFSIWNRAMYHLLNDTFAGGQDGALRSKPLMLPQWNMQSHTKCGKGY